MSEVIVNLTDKHRIVIDHLNHTLQEYHPVSETRREARWLPLGYYSTIQGAMRQVATYNGLEPKEYDAIHYADSVLQKAYDVIEESQK